MCICMYTVQMANLFMNRSCRCTALLAFNQGRVVPISSLGCMFLDLLAALRSARCLAVIFGFAMGSPG